MPRGFAGSRNRAAAGSYPRSASRIGTCYAGHSYFMTIHSFHRFIHMGGRGTDAINQQLAVNPGTNCG
nr:hypothetical protein MFLOJ_36140 [Mycobacterium florentinum]